MNIRFADLKEGDTFDFIDKKDPWSTSFFQRCKKISSRKYISEDGFEHKVGSIYCYVFNVALKNE